VKLGEVMAEVVMCLNGGEAVVAAITRLPAPTNSVSNPVVPSSWF